MYLENENVVSLYGEAVGPFVLFVDSWNFFSIEHPLMLSLEYTHLIEEEMYPQARRMNESYCREKVSMNIMIATFIRKSRSIISVDDYTK